MPLVSVPPPPESVIVNVSVAPALLSSRIKSKSCSTGASEVVSRSTGPPPAGVKMTGATSAGSVSVTMATLLWRNGVVAVSSTVPLIVATLLTSLSVNVVVADVPGAPAVGVKTSASSSVVMAAAVPVSV